MTATAATPHAIGIDTLYPRDAEHRYRLYARMGHDLVVLAATGTPGGVGEAIVQIHEDQKAVGRRLADLGTIGVLDVMPNGKPSPAGEWIVLPYGRGHRDGA